MEGEPDLVALDRDAESRHEADRLRIGLIPFRGEHRVRAASPFGHVHRAVGVAQEGLRIGSVCREHRNAEARAEVDRVAADVQRLREGAEDPLGDLDRGGLAGAAQHEGELVAAQAGHGVTLADRMTQPRRDLAQDFVAFGMTERVVDVFEVVQIRKDDGEGLTGPPARHDVLR